MKLELLYKYIATSLFCILIAIILVSFCVMLYSTIKYVSIGLNFETYKSIFGLFVILIISISLSVGLYLLIKCSDIGLYIKRYNRKICFIYMIIALLCVCLGSYETISTGSIGLNIDTYILSIFVGSYCILCIMFMHMIMKEKKYKK